MDGPVTPAGRVISVGGRGDDPEAQVDFGEDYGVKHLLLCATIENSDLNRRWPRTGADGATYRASLQIRLRGLPLT